MRYIVFLVLLCIPTFAHATTFTQAFANVDANPWEDTGPTLASAQSTMDNAGTTWRGIGTALGRTTQDSNHVEASARFESEGVFHEPPFSLPTPISLSYTLTGPQGALVSWSLAHSGPVMNVNEHFAGLLPAGEIVSTLTLDMAVGVLTESHALSRWDAISPGGWYTVDLAGLLGQQETAGNFGLSQIGETQYRNISQGNVSALFQYAAVPEPSTWLLLALGICVALGPKALTHLRGLRSS